MTKINVNGRLKTIKVYNLPPQSRAFIALIGLPETLRLLRAYGGTPVYIPKSSDNSKKLAEVLSTQSIDKLANTAMAGRFISLPKVDKLLQQIRNMDIISQRGIKSRRELAQEYNLTTRHIQGIWSVKPEKEQDDDTSPQYGLFSK